MGIHHKILETKLLSRLLAPVHSGSERHRVGGYTTSGRVGCWCWSVGSTKKVSGGTSWDLTASSPLKNGAWLEYDRLSFWDSPYFQGGYVSFSEGSKNESSTHQELIIEPVIRGEHNHIQKTNNCCNCSSSWWFSPTHLKHMRKSKWIPFPNFFGVKIAKNI